MRSLPPDEAVPETTRNALSLCVFASSNMSALRFAEKHSTVPGGNVLFCTLPFDAGKQN